MNSKWPVKKSMKIHYDQMPETDPGLPACRIPEALFSLKMV